MTIEDVATRQTANQLGASWAEGLTHQRAAGRIAVAEEELGPTRAFVQTPGRPASKHVPGAGLTADLARAARALAQVSVTCVADHAGLAPEQLSAFERHLGDLAAPERLRLWRALEDFGVAFISEDDHGGYGVRRKFTRIKVTRLETWENEGGPAYEDDI